MSGMSGWSIPTPEGVDKLVEELGKHKIGPMEIMCCIAMDLIESMSVGIVKVSLRHICSMVNFGDFNVVLKRRDDDFLEKQVRKMLDVLVKVFPKGDPLHEEVTLAMRGILLQEDDLSDEELSFLDATKDLPRSARSDDLTDYKTLGIYWGIQKAPVYNRFYDSITFSLWDGRKLKIKADSYWGTDTRDFVYFVKMKDPGEVPFRQVGTGRFSSLKDFAHGFIDELARFAPVEGQSFESVKTRFLLPNGGP